MDITITTPVQIFINGKFFCTATSVEVKRNSPEFRKSILPDNVKLDPNQYTGTVINIKKNLPTTKEKNEVKQSLKADYDEFFQRMTKAVGDPDAHIPVDQ